MTPTTPGVLGGVGRETNDHPARSPSAPHATSTPTIAFVGGGSGGHISPGLAIAERLRELAPHAKLLFICSTRAIDATMLGEADARFYPVPAAPMSLRPLAFMRFVAAFRRARAQAEEIIDRERVTQVVALGGFVAAPAAAAGVRRHVPVTLVNLDAQPGRANRWLAGRSDRVLSAVPTAHDPTFARRIERTGGRIVGMPLRRLAVAPGEPAECRARLGLDPDRRTLLVTGASQGSSSINTLMSAMIAQRPRSFDGWQVLHLAGAGEHEPIVAAYRAAGVSAVVLPFLHRMGLAWGSADAAITRAGASSVAEAAANSVPSLFLPYPYHRDLHQKLNAQPLVDLGGALIELDRVDVDANLREVAPVLERLLIDHDARLRMRAALRTHPPDDAAATIARMLLEG